MDNTAGAIAQLEADAALVAALASGAQADALAARHLGAGGDWRGPAHWAFAITAEALALEVGHAAEALVTARRLVEAAAYELRVSGASG